MKFILKRFDRAQWSWALADWANSAYTTTVIAVFFPIFFKQYWGADLPASESTYYLGLSNSLCSLLLFFTAPFLGALADISGRKKHYMLGLTAFGSAMLIPFFLLNKGEWTWALAFFTLSNLGFWTSNVFYDGLIMDVSTPLTISRVSGLGYSLGYLGGGLLIVINAWMTQSPQTFGLNNAAEAVQWSFLSVSLWWFLFSLPAFFGIRETTGTRKDVTARLIVKEGVTTLKHMAAQRSLFLFLLAYIFYIDGVNTIIKMAVDFALSIGLQSGDLITAIILVQFIGFPATLVYASLAEKIGDLAAIYVGLVIYAFATVYSYFISSAPEFYGLALCIGLAQGGLQAMSRSYFGKMTPRERSGEFFGIYNMVGKFSAILGPLFIGVMNLWTNNPRLSILVILFFFIVGGVLLKLSSQALKKEKGATRGASIH